MLRVNRRFSRWALNGSSRQCYQGDKTGCLEDVFNLKDVMLSNINTFANYLSCECMNRV